MRSAVDHAFKRAWRTIVAADLASFIGAALLFWLTVGAVRGFAFFLGLSTLLDLVTAYFFKRPMVALLARSRFLTEARWIGVRAGLGDSEHRVVVAPLQREVDDDRRRRRRPPPKKRGPLGRLYHGETNIDFIGRTKLWFAISGVFLLIGLGSLLSKGLNLGIDFEGGAVYEVPTDTLTVNQARDALGSLGDRRPEGAGAAELSTLRKIRVQTPTLDPAQGAAGAAGAGRRRQDRRSAR